MSTAVLKIENISMRFGGILALENISFSVEERSITSLIGPNGAGKTTVFNCCTGIYRPTLGDVKIQHADDYVSIVEVCGRKVQSKDYMLVAPWILKRVQNLFRGTYRVNRLGLARTFQNIRLFKNMTVIENLLVAQHKGQNWNLVAGVLQTKNYKKKNQASLERAFFWLKKLKLEDDAQKLAGALPYGKARMLEIARAMCTDPRIICLDEPAAGLNPVETNELSHMILELRKEFPITIFLIEHDMSMVMKISDHIVVLDHGVVIAEGKPEAVKANPKVIDAYLGKE